VIPIMNAWLYQMLLKSHLQCVANFHLASSNVDQKDNKETVFYVKKTKDDITFRKMRIYNYQKHI
jgi:hypothetical protein